MTSVARKPCLPTKACASSSIVRDCCGRISSVTSENASTLASICSRLDGIPLAIELAAPRLRSMSVEEVSQRLDQRFALLTDGSRAALPRHRTLRSMIDWSYDLLTEVEKAMLHRVAVFAGGWTLASAEAVCAGDGIDTSDVLDLLTSLADKSLIVVDEQDGATRYRMLETVREYALDRLRESGGEPKCRDRHFAGLLALAEEAFAKMQGPEQREWLTRLANEHDNLRAALAWSVYSGVEDGLRLAASLPDFWRSMVPCARHVTGVPACWRWLPRQLRAGNRARLLHVAATLALAQADYVAAEQMFLESLDLCRDIERAERSSLCDVRLGLHSTRARRLRRCRSARARRRGDSASHGRPVAAHCESQFLGIGRPGPRRLGSELTTISRRLSQLRETSATLPASSRPLNGLGRMPSAKQDTTTLARKHLKEAITISHELDFRRGIVEALEGFATLALATGSTLRAVRLWGCAESIAPRVRRCNVPRGTETL